MMIELTNLQYLLPVQDQGSHYSSMDWGRIHKAPLLAEELVTVDGY